VATTHQRTCQACSRSGRDHYSDGLGPLGTTLTYVCPRSPLARGAGDALSGPLFQSRPSERDWWASGVLVAACTTALPKWSSGGSPYRERSCERAMWHDLRRPAPGTVMVAPDVVAGSAINQAGCCPKINPGANRCVPGPSENDLTRFAPGLPRGWRGVISVFLSRGALLHIISSGAI